MNFGSVTASGRYSSNPISSNILQQFNYEFGDRPGMNFFRSEEAMHADAISEGNGKNIFTLG